MPDIVLYNNCSILYIWVWKRSTKCCSMCPFTSCGINLNVSERYRQNQKTDRFVTQILRQIRSIRRSLTSDARKTLVNAFVMSRLDYCNSLCQGINEGLLNKLQHIQNAAARLVTDTRKYDHITPVLRDLHWLPIRQRIVFKLATMVYKCQHGLCPSYLAEDCILLSATRGRQHLRSAGRLELLVPRTRTVTFGPRAWNSLPPALREPTLSFNCFRRGLKTFLFR